MYKQLVPICLQQAHKFMPHIEHPHRVHLAWWLSRAVYVPGGLEFEPQRLRGFFGFPGV